MEMLPEPLQDHPTASAMKPCSKMASRWSSSDRTCWPARLARNAVRHCHGRQGNNLIVDDALCDGEMPEYMKLLSASTHLVGVFAPLDILEERERRRGDRLIGLARWQYGRVHNDVAYDLEIDTSTATPIECAKRIRQKFQL